MRKSKVFDSNECSPYERDDKAGQGTGTGCISARDMPLMHKRLLENLLYFDEFCRQHKLHYCLSAGSCLGAVREHGFIPWDDDVDVAMFRNDFDRLFELWDKYGDKTRFELYRTTKEFCANVPIGLLRNKKTTFIRDYDQQDDIYHGVKIDIEPLDEIPNNILLRKIWRITGSVYSLFITQRIPNQADHITKIGAKILLGVFRTPQLRYYIWKVCENIIKKYNGKCCDYVAINAVDGVMKRSDILNSVTQDFEGHELQVPHDYDSYLRAMYGEYMTRPPLNKRYPIGRCVFYNLNSPCEKYKGKYYFPHKNK